MIFVDVCNRCEHFDGTWKTGPNHGVKCNLFRKRTKRERTRMPIDAMPPKECPFMAEQIVSQRDIMGGEVPP